MKSLVENINEALSSRYKNLAKELLKDIEDIDTEEAYENVYNFLADTLSKCNDRHIAQKAEELLDRASKENAFETSLYDDMLELISDVAN